MEGTIPGLIAKKRDAKELNDRDIRMFVKSLVNKDMHESQIGAMLMAIYLNDLSINEMKVLARELADSGATLSWPQEWDNLLVDKHSTGGVGDKVSLVVAPALAALGLKVPRISGRGLGHSGGTLDKLESIPGCRVQLTPDEMRTQLETVGCFIASQTETVCPAEKRIYTIRDVTATVEHVGLVAPSIISKKAAAKIKTLVLDIKMGKGAFMTDMEQAEELARALVSCGVHMGIKTTCLLTDMNSPLGTSVGNAVEVLEAINCMKGTGTSDLLEIVADIGGHVLYTNGNVTCVQEGCDKIRDVIAKGQALSKFREMIKAQGVNRQLADDLCDTRKDARKMLPQAANHRVLTCKASGYVHNINAMSVARTVHTLSGGRNHPDDVLNLAVGVEFFVSIGKMVSEGLPWVVVHYDDEFTFYTILKMMEGAIEIKDTPCERKPRLLQVIT